MLKAMAKGADGRAILVLGLTARNLEDIQSRAGDSFLNIDGKELGLPVDIVIFFGKTEAIFTEVIKEMIGPNTRVRVDPKLRS